MWPKDLLGLRDLGAERITQVLDTADVMRQVFERPVKKFPTLRGRVVVNLFYEPSTRTRTSFELAAKALSADVTSIAVAQSSVVKGESLVDTARTLQALGADFVVIRHSSAGAPHLVSRTIPAAVVNAGDGANEHPTQGLLDLYTIRRHKGRIAGLRVLIVGDILHSRVARSDFWGLLHLGAEVAVAGPRTLMPEGLERSYGIRRFERLDDGLEWADVVNVLRIQRERMQRGYLPSLREYRARWGLTAERLGRLKEDALIMHPGPANVGVEIDEAVVHDPRTVITEQVTNGVAVRMAVLYLMSGAREKDGLVEGAAPEAPRGAGHAGGGTLSS
ncbi:aspartate carbamoyltransferase catalytic subunit [Carboxydochorda subterranea]|uniref:Aspartate carbamoyltransferase n=1 Tax=Carboxydichorda subterranea TaxID=3109565 RepID=A0ABZ1C053_9FIRM|nr:aspartate carbamoyltransferase catalytic subunit [Limnochorda sp. L945t]WRP18383.1 aspartate carbamoyltransferase catalytic subunit [Limnochorda sp. L945t]